MKEFFEILYNNSSVIIGLITVLINIVALIAIKRIKRMNDIIKEHEQLVNIKMKVESKSAILDEIIKLYFTTSRTLSEEEKDRIEKYQKNIDKEKKELEVDMDKLEKIQSILLESFLKHNKSESKFLNESESSSTIELKNTNLDNFIATLKGATSKQAQAQ